MVRKVPGAAAEFESLVQVLELVEDPPIEDLEPVQNQAHPKDLLILVAAARSEAKCPNLRVLDPGQAVQAIRAALVRIDDA